MDVLPQKIYIYIMNMQSTFLNIEQTLSSFNKFIIKGSKKCVGKF